MSDVLHATWLPSTRSLFLWGEADDAPPKKGRRAKLPAHPFPSDPDRLRALFPPAVASRLEEHTATLWLPSVDSTPLPSPELLETGALAAPEGEPRLAAWRVAGLLVPVDPALDLLLAPPAGMAGADMRAWRVAALLAMELLAGQQVLAGLAREGFRLRATWLLRPAPATAQKLTALARSLPPLCRAAVADPAAAPAPRALLDDFLTAAVDSSIRSLPLTLREDKETKETKERPRAIVPTPDLPVSLSQSSPGGKWLAALTGRDSIVDLKGAEADALYKAWQAWAGQGQAAGDDVFRITFRLEPPDRDDRPWSLAYLLRATDDPSLLVPAAQIWRERGASFSYLDRRFEHPQERLLAGLGYAARIFPPLEAGLRRKAPDRASLSAGEAFTFLKEAAP